EGRSLEVQAAQGINPNGFCALWRERRPPRMGDRVAEMGRVSRGAPSYNGPLKGFRGLALAALLVGMAAPAALSLVPSRASAQAVGGGEIADFYRSRGGAPLWFAPRSGAAAQQLVQLLATAQADNLNPRRYNLKALARAVQAASTGAPGAVQ